MKQHWPRIRDGAAAAGPICLGYLPIGLALGVLARKAGFSPLDIGLMSILVFAGGAQFIAVAMISQGASAPAIVFTTFIVNLRHILMSSALAGYLRGASRPFLLLFAYGVTDESFAVNIGRFRDSWDRQRALMVNHLANATWIVATIVGAWAGSLIPENAFGTGFALPAMFLALLVLQLPTRIHVLTAILATFVSLLWYLLVPAGGHALVAAVIAASGGWLLEERRNRDGAR